MDKYRIDSHKLIYHVDRVSDWLKGDNIYPVYMEVSPSGACNHRCTYCALDFMDYQPRFYDTAKFKASLTELGSLGLKSIMYAGEGEPFLHKDMVEILQHAKSVGIDNAITTNAVLFTENIAESVMRNTQWIKVSVNGATKETYSKIHRTKPDDFNKMVNNMTFAAKLRAEKGLNCALGMQLLLLPENADEAVSLARLARDIGMDYLVIKPYSQHPQSKTTQYSNVKYSDYLHLKEELEKLNTDKFNVVFRLAAMRKWDEADKAYKRCQALPFWSYVDSVGNVWGCSMYLNDERFLYGNIFEQSFKEIWQGDKRKQSLNFVEQELDTCNCRVNCRMDEINRYLWDLKNPPVHVNFI